ncbi:MAG: DUF1080 domain-containing protein, partial [Fimbriimonadaceae bacterium]|nr:DUF1080 domain-containing protein [Fimbriimonadaceae bacterium]
MGLLRRREASQALALADGAGRRVGRYDRGHVGHDATVFRAATGQHHADGCRREVGDARPSRDRPRAGGSGGGVRRVPHEVEGLTASRTMGAMVALVALALLVQGQPLNEPPKGFVALFNGRDLSGWKGLVASPPQRAKMNAETLASEQANADQKMRAHWKVEDGTLVFDGKGDSLCTAKDYGDF